MGQESLASDIGELRIPALVVDSAFQYDAELEFDRAELNQLRDIWREKTKSKPIASRAEFDARTLKPFMRNMVILDVETQQDGNRRYRNRYEGSAVVEVFGEQTGRYLDEYVPADRLERWRAAHDLSVLSGRPLRFVINYNSPQISYLRSEVFMIPLSEDGTMVNMLMAFNYFGPKAER
jgi:hypothetical protein